MKRIWILIVAVVVVMGSLYAVAESAGWTDAARVRNWLDGVRQAPGGLLTAGAVIALLLTVDLVLPVPSSVLMTLSGAFLGIAAGTAVSFVGAMGSALLGYGLCRRFGHRAFERMAGPGDAARVSAFLERHGAWAVLLSRSVPMLTEIVSGLAGLSRMRFPLFLALSAAGTLPVCAVYAWAGARADALTDWRVAVAVAFLLPAAGFAVVRLHRRRG